MIKKTDVQAYKVVVDRGRDRATLICITYALDTHGDAYGAEFHTLVSTFENEGIGEIYGRALSFKEEMILYWYGSAITPLRRENISDWIREKMREVFGDCQVMVEVFR